MTTEAALTPVMFCKCLADDTRARIALLLFSEGELCVCELSWALDQSQPKISRHLALLRASGLLTDRKQGQWVYYQLNPHAAPWIAAILSSLLAAHEEWLTDNYRRLETMVDRPNRCC